ncbi:MAG: threonylcarbamoyl-AMP synthase [Saprospiraceae bacterium]|nr:MAG: threonylcarbamoyl-AMP synthase [Saprospiraceae bacterium]
MIGIDIKRAATLLREGQVVAIPTETVYGLAGNALSENAVATIFAVKNRPYFDPLIIHTNDFQRVGEWVENIPDQARYLAEALLPGPLTFLLPKKPIIPDLVTAGSSLVAIRIPQHPFSQALLAQLDFPLAAPSANPFGYISPTNAQHVEQQLGDQIPYILDGGPCQVGVESTIIGFPDGRPVVYRKGGIAIETIEQLIGPLEVKEHSASNPQAPGMLKSHYAPRVPLILGEIEQMLPLHQAKRLGILSFQKRFPNIPSAQQIILSPSGDFREAAQHLFSGLRHLDNLDLDIILAELLPEKDLGRAINDRLRRAAQR